MHLPTAVDWNQTVARISLRGQDGKLMSAITGNETDHELRALVLRFTEHYECDQSADHNPFRMLSGLSRESLHRLIADMNRETMLFLFESECECRNRKPVGPTRVMKPGHE